MDQSCPIIYNLFPRLFYIVNEWKDQVHHISEMGFNKIFVNPVHLPGNSQSLYSIKDYYTFNPQWGTWEDFKDFVQHCKTKNIDVIVDLVINHTAVDSVIVQEHPEWYEWNNNHLVHPGAMENNHWVEWRDLAKINNNDRNVQVYWDKLIEFFQDMGVNDFRCDAAYQVPSQVWRELIRKACLRNENSVFYAESLGCTNDQINNLKFCGFEFLFNSSKYWNYDSSWAIDQHNTCKHIAPSISFAESHDTSRVAADQPRSENMQKNRYLFSAIFSEGVMMPIGYEYMSTIPLHVVNSKPIDFTTCKNNGKNISDFIKYVNNLKKTYSEFDEEGHWNIISDLNSDVIVLEKRSNNGQYKATILINKDWYNSKTVWKNSLPQQAHGCSKVIAPFDCRMYDFVEQLRLQPSEIVILY